ncbi:hypothetical protein Pelo_8735 [Pelomyxa schiedti]|nr:hypothetical protein Pelo_8735 [Pelomyxa schiedti]
MHSVMTNGPSHFDHGYACWLKTGRYPSKGKQTGHGTTTNSLFGPGLYSSGQPKSLHYQYLRQLSTSAGRGVCNPSWLGSRLGTRLNSSHSLSPSSPHTSMYKPEVEIDFRQKKKFSALKSTFWREVGIVRMRVEIKFAEIYLIVHLDFKSFSSPYKPNTLRP